MVATVVYVPPNESVPMLVVTEAIVRALFATIAYVELTVVTYAAPNTSLPIVTVPAYVVVWPWAFVRETSIAVTFERPQIVLPPLSNNPCRSSMSSITAYSFLSLLAVV